MGQSRNKAPKNMYQSFLNQSIMDERKQNCVVDFERPYETSSLPKYQRKSSVFTRAQTT